MAKDIGSLSNRRFLAGPASLNQCHARHGVLRAYIRSIKHIEKAFVIPSILHGKRRFRFWWMDVFFAL